ncbi:hypothetical protein Tco_1558201 [Tanacetum coccineum]
MDLTAAAKNRFMELNELIELRDGAYEITESTKKEPRNGMTHGFEEIKISKQETRLEKYHDGHINEEEKEVVELDDDTT